MQAAWQECHLLFVMQDKSGKEVSGFSKSISSTASACLLKLKPEDQGLLDEGSFKNGRFTWVTEAGSREHWVVASCGNYMLKWNFRYTCKHAGFLVEQLAAQQTSPFACSNYQR